MPFAVFRRHQRKLLAVFAILAMFGFVVADSLPRLLSGGPYAGGNPVVVELFGRSVRRADVVAMQTERNNANLFMAELTAMAGMPRPQFFGGLNTRDIVDALILQHEADRLGLPKGPEAGREWLRQRAPFLNRDLFELILKRFNNRVSGDQLLAEIASQVRIRHVRELPVAPVITPLDVFQAYRDQNERVSAKVVGFPVSDFAAKVPEPSASELQAYYDRYKDVLPDHDRPTPGFKVPRQVKVEILELDGESLARSIKEKLTDADLKAYYENRKAEFKRPSEFPDEIFLGQPDLTPPQYVPFEDQRPYLANSLAEERAQAEIVAKFERIKDETLIPFAEKYLDAADAIAEAKKQGESADVSLPKPDSLEAVAKKEGLRHEITPLLSHDRAEKYGMISGAEVGLTPLSGGKKFAEEVFDAKSSLFEPIELADLSRHRYLVRKLEDQAPRVPPLDEIKAQVVEAWKTEQARPKAEEAAKAFAEKVRKEGGKIKGEVAEGHPVVMTDLVTKLQPGLPVANRFFENGPATPSDIPQLPHAGAELRDALFGLTDGAVAVAPNEPKTVYYVLTQDQRLKAGFAALYSPTGDLFRYRTEVMMEAGRKRDDQWMGELRTQAGLQPGWVPEDEAKEKDARNG